MKISSLYAKKINNLFINKMGYVPVVTPFLKRLRELNFKTPFINS